MSCQWRVTGHAVRLLCKAFVVHDGDEQPMLYLARAEMLGFESQSIGRR
jgi:hypothetical protein